MWRDSKFLCSCSGVAGCCAKTTIAPLDRVKILLQAQSPHYKHLGKTSIAKHGKADECLFSHLCATWVKPLNFFFFFFSAGVFSTLKAVPQKEGFLGLYKGNGAMMVRIFPYGAIQFMAFDNYKKVQYICVDLYWLLVNVAVEKEDVKGHVICCYVVTVCVHAIVLQPKWDTVNVFICTSLLLVVVSTFVSYLLMLIMIFP